MSMENNIVDSGSDDLDAFSDTFFGQKEATPEPASSEKQEDAPKETDASETNDDTHVEEEDNLDDTETDDDSDGEDKGEEKPEPKPKKSRAAERIEELNKKYRETERLVKELQEQLKVKNEPPAPKQEVEVKRPSPTDQNEDGTDKYPLGEFDPAYIRDDLKFDFDQERKAREVEAAEKSKQSEVEAARTELQNEWNGKLGTAQERYPDFHEKGEALQETLQDVDQGYGEYLATTIMQMEYGPDVLYYLASNPDEARKIVDAGPLKATIALGRLESKFAVANEEKQKARPKVSNAPTPPPTNKGSAVTVPEVPADTDDLDSFEKVFFKKKK